MSLLYLLVFCVGVFLLEAQCFDQQVLSDGRVEFDYVKIYETSLVLIRDLSEPVQSTVLSLAVHHELIENLNRESMY